MLSPRTATILNSIIGQYIIKATPVSSQSVLADCQLDVSPATVRNDMAHLEQEGYITRPHTSAGSIPSDKGYRYYVESIGNVKLPLPEQRLVSHLFHQVETSLDEWLHLATALIAQMAQNVAIVTTTKSEAGKFKHLELVGLHDAVILAIFVLSGANVKQQLITFDHNISQAELTTMAIKLSAAYSGLPSSQIVAKEMELSPAEQQITDCLVAVMQAQDSQSYEEQHLDGLHFTLNQPEFAHSQRMQALMELIEQRTLLKSIMPVKPTTDRIQVIIGRENQSEVIRDYSVVIRQYGLPEEAIGKIVVVGPTRMPYARTIATVEYLSLVLTLLMAKLYGRTIPIELNLNTTE